MVGRKKRPWVFCHPWEGTKHAGSNGREKKKIKKKRWKRSEEKHAAFPLPGGSPRGKGDFFSSLPSHPPRPKPFQLELPFVVQRALPLILHLALVCVVAAGGRDGGSRRVFVANGVVGLGVCFFSPGESGFGLGLKCGGEKGAVRGCEGASVCVRVCVRACVLSLGSLSPVFVGRRLPAHAVLVNIQTRDFSQSKSTSTFFFFF